MDDGGIRKERRRGVARLREQLLEVDEQIERVQQLVVESQQRGQPSLDLEQALLLLLEARAVCKDGLDGLLAPSDALGPLRKSGGPGTT